MPEATKDLLKKSKQQLKSKTKKPFSRSTQISKVRWLLMLNNLTQIENHLKKWRIFLKIQICHSVVWSFRCAWLFFLFSLSTPSVISIMNTSIDNWFTKNWMKIHWVSRTSRISSQQKILYFSWIKLSLIKFLSLRKL